MTKRFRVDPGNYLIIPSTYDEDHNCEFMLRVYTETPIEAGSLDEDKDPGDLVIFAALLALKTQLFLICFFIYRMKTTLIWILKKRTRLKPTGKT